VKQRLITALSAVLLGISALSGAASADFAVAGSKDSDLPCAGAASRDPEQHCSNHSLRFRVFPDPADALLEPGPPCITTEKDALFSVCAFGASADDASATIALIGDSHAEHFRPALRDIANRLNLRVLTIWRPGCPLSSLPPGLDAQRSADCVTWSQHVVTWLGDHPEVHTVFLSAHATARVIPPLGVTRYEAKVGGYVAAIESLPVSVENVVVLRDIPGNPVKTSTCVTNAIERQLAAGEVCQIRREKVLPADALAEAVSRIDLPNVHLADLTPFMCGRQYCRPVIGGVLVHKDGDHLTRQFASSLGPYVQRAVARMTPRIEGFSAPAPALQR